jgi:hypothetical protein
VLLYTQKEGAIPRDKEMHTMENYMSLNEYNNQYEMSGGGEPTEYEMRLMAEMYGANKPHTK